MEPILDDLDEFESTATKPTPTDRPLILWLLMVLVGSYGWFVSFPWEWLDDAVLEVLKAFILLNGCFLLLPLFWGVAEVFEDQKGLALGYGLACLGCWGMILLGGVGIEVPSLLSVSGAVLALLTIELQRAYAPHPVLWGAVRTLLRLYLMVWGLLNGLTWFGMRHWYTGVALWFLPLSLGLVAIGLKTWPILHSLPRTTRWLWWGAWLALYGIGLSQGVYGLLGWADHWQLEWPENLVYLVGYAAHYSDVCRRGSLILLVVVGIGAGYPILKSMWDRI